MDISIQQEQHQQTRHRLDFQILRPNAEGVDVVEFDTSKVLGRGTYGIVYEGNACSSGVPLAVKVIRFGHGGTKSAAAATFRVELAIVMRLRALSHPNLVRLFDAFVPLGGGGGINNNTGVIVMERVASTTLEEYMEFMEQPFSPAAIASIFVQICSAVAALHGVGIVHRDIKAANVTYDPSTNRAVLIDFSFALPHHRNPKMPIFEFSGTPLSLPLECLTSTICFPFAQDMFALGNILYVLYEGRDMHAHCRSMEELRDARRDFPVAIPPRMPVAHAALLRMLTGKDPHGRPTTPHVQEIVRTDSFINAAAPANW